MRAELWKRVEELFEAALELPPHQRAEFLEKACPSDPEIRSEVQSLVDRAENSFLEGSPLQPTAEPVPALAPGDHIESFEILELLGRGGMGEVYRARDSRLKREVAIKILLGSAGTDPNRLRRFRLEAASAGALNHPNILAIYDIGLHNGAPYLVSELLEGESLRMATQKRRLSLRQAIDYAAQTAAGLAAAHQKGIVHRDIKPENLWITKDRRVKILDFGLARQTSIGQAVATDSIAAKTVPGVILGTVAYMSPEQARGEAVDHRSDQFSFGVVLYELISGIRLFHKATAVETLAAIVTEESPLEHTIPAPLRWILDRCLAKDPAQRYDSTRDLYWDLLKLQDRFSELSGGLNTSAARTAAIRRIWRVLAGIALLLVAFGSIVLLMHKGGRDLAQYRFSPLYFSAQRHRRAAWSPDGKAFAYVGEVNGTMQLFVRTLNSPVPTQLTKGPGYPRPLIPLAWSQTGNRLYVLGLWKDSTGSDPKEGLFSIASVGGDMELIRPLEAFTPSISLDSAYPASISPDSKALAILHNDSDGLVTVATASPIDGALHRYSPDPFAIKTLYNLPELRFSPDSSKILLTLSGEQGREEIWLLPFPPGRGSPRRVLKNLRYFGGSPGFSWMPDSRHVVLSLAHRRDSNDHLWIADIDSNDVTPLTAGIGPEQAPAVSPDGSAIIYADDALDMKVVSLSLSNGSVNTLVADAREQSMAAWAARVPKLVYVTNRRGAGEIWMRNADGSDQPVVTANDLAPGAAKWFVNPSLSPDGDRLVFSLYDANGKLTIWVRVLPFGAPAILEESSGSEGYAGAWSPEGDRLAFLEVAGVKRNLTIAKIGSRTQPLKLAADVQERLPDWSPMGDWITFCAQDGWKMISPDGRRIRSLGKIDTLHLAFSKDGKRLYGIRFEENRQYFFWIDGTTFQMKTIKELRRDDWPNSIEMPGIRLSLAPDGKSAVYTAALPKSNLWLLEGFTRPSLLQGLGLRPLFYN